VRSRLAALEAMRKPKHLDLKDMFESLFKSNPTWPAGTKILTDDYAPVDLLKDEK
jgi:spermidine synthase